MICTESDCLTCKGTGTTVPDFPRLALSIAQREWPCPACGGTGITERRTDIDVQREWYL